MLKKKDVILIAYTRVINLLETDLAKDTEYKLKNNSTVFFQIFCKVYLGTKHRNNWAKP